MPERISSSCLPGLRNLGETTRTISKVHRPVFNAESPSESSPMHGADQRQLILSGFYWGALSAEEAHNILSCCAPGTFLIRDSAHPAFLFALSLKTELGATNIRISGGVQGYRLDSHPLVKPKLFTFPSCLALVEFYSLAGQGKHLLRHCGRKEVKSRTEGNLQGWNDHDVECTRREQEVSTEGQDGDASHVDVLTEDSTTGFRLCFNRPFYHAAPSLKHLCRIAINRDATYPSSLPLPKSLISFLEEYPFVL
uniref:suppressor of cytokine signaling 2-like isoform X2 n=1 Tax=Myxine glutinosa TaxID=7769 RepID=UPI00358FC9C5